MNKRSLQLIFGFALIVAIVAAVSYRDSFDLDLIEHWLDQAGRWAPPVFITIYVLATVLFLPSSFLTLSGGILFGPVLGVVYNLAGASIGAALAFLIARYLASDVVSARSGRRVKQLVSGVETEGWRFVALVRLVPIFPFTLLNYALGLTKIPFIEYFLASAIFMLPATIAYTYLGYAGRKAIAGSDDLISSIIIAVALLAMVMFLPRFIAELRRGPSIDVNELKRRIEKRETLVLDVRTENDFVSDGHIAQALNIPVERLEDQMDKLDDYLEKSISIVCRTDKRSAAAANILLKRGFHDVHVVRGGMTEWNKQSEISSSQKL
ncbi:MAG: VTT domain-containing protein [Gammaproteobacteria bacterium]|nr:VTT domain-containing protein [Gammaproteobacteria bacterium]